MSEPHVRFEYDPEFCGGDYAKVGRFAYVPARFLDDMSPEEAFTKRTGLGASCVIHYTLDELFSEEGELLEG